jgi:plasmid stability protein
MDKPRKLSRSVHYFDEPEVVEEIEQRAYEHGHSMAAEIRSAIRKSLEEQRR